MMNGRVITQSYKVSEGVWLCLAAAVALFCEGGQNLTWQTPLPTNQIIQICSVTCYPFSVRVRVCTL